MNLKNLFTLMLLWSVAQLMSAPTTIVKNLKIDQFGYLPNAQKVAVISNPVLGYNTDESFAPSTGNNQYEIRRWSDDVTVFQGTITPWGVGGVHPQSGDIAWWFDFSTLTTPGNYYVYDVGNDVGSYQFSISETVYNEVLKQSVRTFFYQRCGHPKAVPYAESGWADGACHIGNVQDSQCRLYSDPNNPATEKDLSGGWHDAGDYNKYVTYTWKPLIDLLMVYEEKPSFWGDDFDIPESGNGVPDILDEIKIELDWLLKMQQSDGGVLAIVGSNNFGNASPPSADNLQRLYGSASTSATISAAGIFALASKIYQTIPSMTAYANTLKTAATNAWNWSETNPDVTFYHGGVIAATEPEISEYHRFARKVAAAGFLCFIADAGDVATYKNYFESNYGDVHLALWAYVYPYEHTEQDALLYYTKWENAAPAIATQILWSYEISMNEYEDNLPAVLDEVDPYRAFLVDHHYGWGCNGTKARSGLTFYNMGLYNLDATNETHYKNGAFGYLHYLHGVNPISKVYLTNMGDYGAENSATQLFHLWFKDGNALWDDTETSPFGPAPGLVTGGPNQDFNVDGCCANSCSAHPGCNTAQFVPPMNQPIQKSYADFNDDWPSNSWEVTENSNTYQASYIRLLASLMEDSSLSTATSEVVLSLEAKTLTPKQIELQWQTTRQNDWTIFEIERSTDERRFDFIGKMETKEGQKKYNWLDTSPMEGVNYYRLKTYRKDGSFTYSDIVQAKTDALSHWKAVPNPTHNTFRLYSEEASTIREIVLMDFYGKSLAHFWGTEAANMGRIDLGDYAAGMYMVKVRDDKGWNVLKVIKK